MQHSAVRLQRALRLAAAAVALLLAACGQQSQPIKLAPPPSAVPTSIAAAGRQASPAPLGSSAVAASPTPSSGASADVSPASIQVPIAGAASERTLPPDSRLQIPSIGVDARLVTMGVDPNGVMQVPANGADVAWYSFSAVPGTAGNAVLSGHVDTATSYTAVFTRLKELKPGAPMDVLENGKKMDFEVFWSKAWPEATAPLPLILGNAPSATLTLITCAGTFDRAARNYTERLVVRAKLPGSI